MKLSEAIRLGAMLKPQGKQVYRNYDGSTCALGAACDAIGQLPELMTGHSVDVLYAAFPILKTVVVPCPVRGGEHAIGSVILHLNDDFDWSRERIADWVATIEAKHDPVIATEDHSSLEPAVELGAQR